MHIRLLTMALALLCAVTSAPLRAAECPDEAALRELKTRHWPALYRNGDVDGLARLLHPSFRVVDAAGTVTTRAEELDWLASNSYAARDFRYEITSLECAGDVAVVIGTGSMLDDADASGTGRSYYVSSNVLQLSDGRWRALLSHISGLRSDAATPE